MSASSTTGSNSSSASTPPRMSLVVPIAVRPFLSRSEQRMCRVNCPGLAGRGYLVPQAAVQVEPVAVSLSRSAVADVGIQRMPVISGLDRPVRAGEHGERADDAG